MSQRQSHQLLPASIALSGSNRVDQSIASCFWSNVCNFPDVDAFASVDADVVKWASWGQIGFLAERWVAQMRRWSLPEGAHLASCLPNSLDWILIDLAAQTLGFVHVAIDPREAASQQRQLFEFSQAVRLFDPASVLAKPIGHSDLSPTDCLQLAREVDRNAVAQILFTSGSDGFPKGVMLSHHNLLTNARAKLAAAPQLHDDLRLNVLPFAHAYARTCELSAWIVSRSRLAIAGSWQEAQRQAQVLRPTLMNVVPYLAEQVAKELEADPKALGGRLRLLQVGGAALGNDLWNRLSQLGLPPLQGYGLTEASPVVCSNRVGKQRAGTVGPPVAGVELKVDEEGVLWCCGPNTMLGYWQNDGETGQCLVDDWLCTGDLADIDDQGNVTIRGRASQQIVLSTGYKVSPEAVERELCNDEWIERAIVCGHGRAHVVALLWPSVTDTLVGTSPSQRLSKQQWQMRISERLNRFPRHAIPVQFAWVDQPLSDESGLLTVKGSLRRSKIEARYSAILAKLYTT